MAKGMYATVGSTTKKITKNYAVINGSTRKVTKMYAVVDGKTRLVWSSGLDIDYLYNGAVMMLCYNSSEQTKNYMQPNNVYVRPYLMSGTTFSDRKSGISSTSFVDVHVSANGKMMGYRTGYTVAVTPWNTYWNNYNVSNQYLVNDADNTTMLNNIISASGLSIDYYVYQKAFIRFNQLATHCILVVPINYGSYGSNGGLAGLVCSVADDGALTYVSTAFTIGGSSFTYSSDIHFDASDDLETLVVAGGYANGSSAKAAVYVRTGNWTYTNVLESSGSNTRYMEGCGVSRDGKYVLIPNRSASNCSWILAYINNNKATIMTNNFINQSVTYAVHRINQTRDGKNLFIPSGLWNGTYSRYERKMWKIKVSGTSYTYIGEGYDSYGFSPGDCGDFSEDDKYVMYDKTIYKVNRNASTGDIFPLLSSAKVSSVTDSVDTDKTNYTCGYCRFINPALG